MFRTHTCGELSAANQGQKVTLAGWVQHLRDLGQMVFIDLRDRYGITQLAFNEKSAPGLLEAAKKLGREYVIQAEGTVIERASKNPNNPTGGIMEKADLEKIAQVVRETGILVISDEIYGELTYGDRTHISFASLPGMWQYTITLNGFSKAFAMTGWRVGYACGPKEILSVMLKIHQYSILCAPRMGQVAALEALQAGRANDYEDVRRMRDSYDRRRRLMVDSFRKMGLDCFEPLGAFYVFPSIKKTGLDSETFCERLLNEYKIATVPGTAFGECGEGHIRCSYATGVEKLNIALERMSEFVDKCGK